MYNIFVGQQFTNCHAPPCTTITFICIKFFLCVQHFAEQFPRVLSRSHRCPFGNHLTLECGQSFPALSELRATARDKGYAFAVLAFQSVEPSSRRSSLDGHFLWKFRLFTFVFVWYRTSILRSVSPGHVWNRFGFH